MIRSVVIGRSPPGGSASDCVDVVTVDASGAGSAQFTLDCSYDDSTLTLCVQYSTADGCNSALFMATIPGTPQQPMYYVAIGIAARFMYVYV